VRPKCVGAAIASGDSWQVWSGDIDRAVLDLGEEKTRLASAS